MSDEEPIRDPEDDPSGESETGGDASAPEHEADTGVATAKSGTRDPIARVLFVLGAIFTLIPVVLFVATIRSGVTIFWHGLAILGAILMWGGIARARGTASRGAELVELVEHGFGNPNPRAPKRGSGEAVGWIRVFQLVLAVALATTAVGLHFSLNVPKGEVKVSNRDQGARKRRPRSKRRPRQTRFEPRGEAELAKVQRRYRDVEFESEPIISRWARRQQALVNKAVVVARKQAFEGAPEDPRVIVTGTKCRTIRCRFLLRSPYAHEVSLLDRALQRLVVDDEPLWREYASKRVDAPPGAPPDDVYLQVTVIFAGDDLSGRNIEAVPAGDEEDRVESGG